MGIIKFETKHSSGTSGTDLLTNSRLTIYVSLSLHVNITAVVWDVKFPLEGYKIRKLLYFRI